ncbi:MAG: hypothetical protein Q7T55_07280 [Solirubrobacteraceae bacterium]|nr:hypothetical protein [Solirubrobacteraceae bacterium]
MSPRRPLAMLLSLLAAVVAVVALTVAAPAGAQRSVLGGTDAVPRTSVAPEPEEPVAIGVNEDPQTACESRNTSGTNCQPGNDRKVPGGGEKVSHAGWPAVSGILWISKTARSRTYRGTQLNDEILSHHKSDTIYGGDGHDILWGDWDPKNNNTSQVDKLSGEEGNDWIYASHGRNTLSGGPGKDFLYAYYGKGTIDCGAGNQDTAKIRLGTGQYTVKNCERILNFCAFGSIGGKRCAKPGEKKAVRASRQ